MDNINVLLKSLSLSGRDDEKFVAYLCQLSSANNKCYFPLPWPGVLVQNCDETGKLLDHWNVSKINNIGLQPWLFVSLKLFHSQVSVKFIKLISQSNNIFFIGSPIPCLGL